MLRLVKLHRVQQKQREMHRFRQSTFTRKQTLFGVLGTQKHLRQYMLLLIDAEAREPDKLRTQTLPSQV